MTETAGVNLVRVARSLRAPRTEVWRAWTEAASLGAWFWPEGFATQAFLEARPGGTYRLSSEVGGLAVGGDVVALDPPGRLELTWRWDGETAITRVVVTLLEEGPGTEVVVVHGGLRTAEERESHALGWASCLDRLVARDQARSAGD